MLRSCTPRVPAFRRGDAAERAPLLGGPLQMQDSARVPSGRAAIDGGGSIDVEMDPVDEAATRAAIREQHGMRCAVSRFGN